jgi:hypothetical protein
MTVPFQLTLDYVQQHQVAVAKRGVGDVKSNI